MKIVRYRPFLLLYAPIHYLLRREQKYFYLNLDSFNRSSPRGCSTCSRPLTPQIPLAVHCRAGAFHFTWDGLRFLSALLWEAITVRLVDYDYSFWKYTVNRNLRSLTLKGFICEWSVRGTTLIQVCQFRALQLNWVVIEGSNPCYTRLVITNHANGPFTERAKTNTKQNDKRLRVAVLKLTIRCLEASKFFTIVQVNLVPS